jgi:hypothetical protein
VHVICGRNNLNGELWVVVSDEPTTLPTLRACGLRFDIEELFKDEQSSGWNLQKSEIRSICDLSKLCFILALATLYVTAKGWLLSSKVSDDGSIPTGFAATAIFASAWNGFRRPY